MIKLALKHWVYEQCIDVLFNAVKNNFSDRYRFKVGDKYVYLAITCVDTTKWHYVFNNVTITRTYYHMVAFECESYTIVREWPDGHTRRANLNHNYGDRLFYHHEVTGFKRAEKKLKKSV